MRIRQNILDRILYDNDLSLFLAKKVGVTQQGIRNAVKRNTKMLRDYMLLDGIREFTKLPDEEIFETKTETAAA